MSLRKELEQYFNSIKNKLIGFFEYLSKLKINQKRLLTYISVFIIFFLSLQIFIYFSYTENNPGTSEKNIINNEKENSYLNLSIYMTFSQNGIFLSPSLLIKFDYVFFNHSNNQPRYYFGQFTLLNQSFQPNVEINDIGIYSGTLVTKEVVYRELFPFDYHNFLLSFDNIDSLNLTNINEVNIRIFYQNQNWIVNNLSSKFSEKGYDQYYQVVRDSKSLEIFVSFERNSFFRFEIISFPLIVMILIVLINFKTGKGRLEKLRKKEVKSNYENLIKMRYDLSKWVFTFGIANLLLISNQTYDIISLYSFINYIALILSFLYFISNPLSKEIGQKENMYQELITWSTEIIIALIVMLVFSMITF